MWWSIGRGLVNRSYDFLIIARGDQAATDAVIVYLDEKSHAELGQPLDAPWDRALHARLVERLTAAGAKVIVFDIVFSDPHTNNPEPDEKLAKAIKAHGRVVLGADNVLTGYRQKEVKRAFDLLYDSANENIGSVEVIPSGDLVVREHTRRDENDQISSLSWASAALLGAKVTKDSNAEMSRRWLNYVGPPNSIPWKRYSEALDPARVGDEFFRDKTVFIGARIATRFSGERKDEYSNPFSAWMTERDVERRGTRFIAGVEVQATAFLNLLHGDWLKRPPGWLESAGTIVLGLLLGFGFVRFRPSVAIWLGIGATAIVVGSAYVIFRSTLFWFPWLIFVVQISFAFSWAIVFNSIQLYVQKRLYEYTLGLYLSPKLVKKFAGDPKFLKPGADELAITILFTDIADFTRLSQNISSDTLAKMMNQYFHVAVSECIHKTDGTVVKYIGDAIFAFWNAPEGQTDHAFRACEAALRFREQGVQQIHGQRLRTRIGVHTGLARVGNFGSPERVDYTALGESVNLASRLEGLNKYLGTDCIISRDTKEGMGDRFVTRSLGAFTLQGFDKPVGVYELVGWPAEAETTRPWREAFAEALNNYEQRNLEFAEIGFRRVLELKPDDGPSKFYLVKLDDLRTQSLPEDWATHTILREK